MGDREARDLRTLSLPQALLLALLAHLAAALLLSRSGASLASWGALTPEEIAALEALEPQPETPLHFEFIDIPDEPEVRSPNAKIASDRARRARSQPLPAAAPPPQNADPYAHGSTDQMVLLRPTPGPALPPAGSAASRTSGGAGSSAAGAPRAPAQEAPDLGPAGSADSGPSEGERPPLLRSVPRVSPGDLSESYDNPGGAASSDIGSISFDTAVSDLGAYQNEMIRRVRRSWYDRFPQAAFSGVRGVVVVSFRVARDGSVSGITLVDSYSVRLGAGGAPELGAGVPPFESASMGAVEALELPPLPDYFSAPDLGVTLSFLYNVRLRR